MAQTADKIYRNAKIYSVALDGTETHAQALAIVDGKFAYVGDEAGVQAWIGDRTEVVDCHGKSVIPGLGDAICIWRTTRNSSVIAASAILCRTLRRTRPKA